MLGKANVADLLKKVLKASKADETEAILMAEDSYLTRFANSTIHQNVSEHNQNLLVRAVLGRKIGCASTNRVDAASVKEVVKRALEIAKRQKENPEFKGLPKSAKAKAVNNYVPATAKFSPRDRAEAVKKITERARKSKLSAFGAFTTGTSEVGVANSHGTLAYNLATDAYCNTVVMSDTGSGYAHAASRDARRVNTARMAETACQKALDSRNPVDLPAGEYEVVLEPAAVADMLGFLAWMGFSATAYQEGRSFLCGKLGQKVMGENITIVDDAYHIKGYPFPFDFEGVPKKKLALIEKGVAKNIVYDSFTAGKEGRESTGHALAAPMNYPLPMHQRLLPGKSTVREMIASIKRGVLVTRFHYTNVLEPMRVVITGMTRDGTFLIEDGKVTRPVRNFRFTQSVLDALSCVSLIGKDAVLVGEETMYGARFAAGIVAPALKVDKFNFTGVTQF